METAPSYRETVVRKQGITIQINGYNFRRRYQTKSHMYWYCKSKGYVAHRTVHLHFPSSSFTFVAFFFIKNAITSETFYTQKPLFWSKEMWCFFYFSLRCHASARSKKNDKQDDIKQITLICGEHDHWYNDQREMIDLLTFSRNMRTYVWLSLK